MTEKLFTGTLRIIQPTNIQHSIALLWPFIESSQAYHHQKSKNKYTTRVGRFFSCGTEVVLFRVVYLFPLILGKINLYSMLTVMHISRKKMSSIITRLKLVKDRYILYSVNL